MFTHLNPKFSPNEPQVGLFEPEVDTIKHQDALNEPQLTQFELHVGPSELKVGPF